jgi:IS605 OrfB family transposase
MQLTSQTRLTLTPAANAQLDGFAQYYAKHLHLLYAHVAAHGGAARDHKTEFSHKHGLSARLFNALAIELQGVMDGTRELLKESKKDTQRQITSTRAALRKSDAIDTKLADGTLKFTKKEGYVRHIRRAGKLRLRLTKLLLKLPRILERLAAKVPGIGFGSRKLFKKQFFLEENGYADHAAWLADWRTARAHQASFVGSKDETAGNQRCALYLDKKLFKLRVRLPDALLAAGQDKYLWIESIELHDAAPAVRAALAAGQALSYKLHKVEGHWRLLVSFARTAAPVTTLEATFGCLGVDFNADHLGVAETDLYGNIIKTWRIDLPLAKVGTAGQRKAELSDALQQVAEYALAEKLPVVVEDLDFSTKKKQLARMSPARARMLSGLAYAQYRQLTASKCFRMGLELKVVNPAYTSVAGRIKYATPFGRSVHLAAAGVIARRGQALTERLPRAKSVRIPVNGTTKNFPVPERKAGDSDLGAWAAIGRELTVFLRKSFLATQAAKLEGAKGRDALGRPEGRVTVPCRRVSKPKHYSK